MEYIFNQISEYILIVDYEGSIVFANDKFINKLGYSKKELYNLDINKIVNYKEVKINNIFIEKNSINREIKFLKSDGKTINLDSYMSIDNFKNKKCLIILSKNIENYSYTKKDLEVLLDNLEIATFIKDKDGKYIYASKAMEKMWDKSQEEIIGKYDIEIWDKDTAKAFRESDTDVIHEKVAKLFEQPNRIDGYDVWFEEYKAPIYDENNELEYIIGSSRDIKLQKLVRNGIHTNYSKVISSDCQSYQDMYTSLNNISNNIIDCLGAQGLSIFIYDKDNKELLPYIKLKNSKKILERVNKIPIEDDIEQEILDGKIHQGFRKLNKIKKQSNLDNVNWDIGDISYVAVYPMKLRDELIGILSISYSEGNEPKYNQDDFFYETADKLAMFIKNYKLSNELKLENQKRKESEKELELYLSISVDLKATLNIDGYIDKVNNVWESLLGWSEEEILSMHYSELVHPEDIPLLESLYAVSFLTEKTKHIVLRFLSKDGDYLWIETSLKYISDREGFLFTGKDITKRKLMEAEKKKLEEAIQLESIRNEFFANISHEFKTPLNIILGTMQLIDRNIDIGNVTIENLIRYVNTIKQNSYRLLRLVNNLIDISRIDVGYYKLQLTNHNIIRIIEDITLSVAEYVQGKNINLLFDTEVEEVILACDPDKVERVILNLLSNAIKYTDDGGSIKVYLKKVDNNIIISVKDSGVGIPKDKIELIFDRFGQANDMFTRRCEGSGIGLSIVKSIVEMHGGDIKVFSEVGKGSEFVFNIPIKVLDEENTIFDCDNKDYHVEKCNIEFSDIYNI